MFIAEYQDCLHISREGFKTECVHIFYRNKGKVKSGHLINGNAISGA